MTMSCIWTDREKQIVLRVNRLIRVRNGQMFALDLLRVPLVRIVLVEMIHGPRTFLPNFPYTSRSREMISVSALRNAWSMPTRSSNFGKSSLML